jgi:hypothetical protein
MATTSKLPAGPVGLVQAATDERLLGKVPLFPMQLEILAAVEGSTRTVLVAGRRAGKSRISALMLVWMALLRPDLRRYALDGEWISFACCATSRDQGKIVLNAAKQAVVQSPLLASLVEREVSDAIFFKNGSVIEAFPCSSRTTRGNPIAALALDEFAFFQTTDEGPAAAVEVHRALTGSMVQFQKDRKVLICSSPNGDNTFRQMYEAAAEHEDELVDAGETPLVTALKLATWEVRPDIPQSVFDEERVALGDELWQAEFGAVFLASGGALLSESDIRGCVTLAGDLDPREITGAVVGMDVGYRRDRSAAVVLGYDHKQPDLLRVASVRTWAPAQDLSQGTEQHAEMVLSGVADLARTYGGVVFGDTYESETTRSRLQRHGASVELTSSAGGVKGAMYRELAMRIRLQQIELPDHPELIAELRRLRVNYRGSSPSVENPRVGDSHGDIGEALARAVFHLAEGGAGGAVFGSYTPPARDSVGGEAAAERGELDEPDDEGPGGGLYSGYYDSPLDGW